MYDFFNISAQYQTSSGQAHGTLYTTYNALLEAMNEDAKLPRFIFVLLDRDLLLQANHFKFGVHIILDEILPWLIKKIEKAILRRREDLKAKCIGAVGHEPRVIWVKMLQRPLIKNHQFQHYNNVVNLRKKFNNTLEDLLARTRNAHIIDPAEILDEYTHFDSRGNLSPEGKKIFWQFVDSEFKKYDRGESDLMPRKIFQKKKKQKQKKSPNDERNWNTTPGKYQDEYEKDYNHDDYENYDSYYTSEYDAPH